MVISLLLYSKYNHEIGDYMIGIAHQYESGNPHLWVYERFGDAGDVFIKEGLEKFIYNPFQEPFLSMFLEELKKQETTAPDPYFKNKISEEEMIKVIETAFIHVVQHYITTKELMN